MTRRRIAWVILALGVAGCASPNPTLYTLAAVPGTPRPGAARSVELRRIGIAGYLDRSEIVHATAQYRLQVADAERWGEPVGGMIERVFTEDLVQRLPGTSVFSESGAISTKPDLTVEVDVQRLDGNAAGEVVLLAQVALRHEAGDRPAEAQTLRLTATPAGTSTGDLVATESVLLGQLADRVAERIAE